MIKVILFLLMCVTLKAYDTLELKNNFSTINVSPYIYYINDKEKFLTPKDILNTRHLKKLSIKANLKPNLGPYWSRVNIRNSSKNIQNFYIYNKIPGMNYVDFYIYKNDKIIDTYFLGDMRKQNLRKYINRYSMFQVSLLPNEQVIIVSKVFNYNIHNISLSIINTQKFLELESNLLFVFGITTGLFLSFGILSIVLFAVFKKIAYVYIFLYSFLSLVYMLSLQGILYQINIGLNLDLINIFAWNSSQLVSSVLLLFTYYFFDIKERYFKISIIIKTLIFANLLFVLIQVYAFYINREMLDISLLSPFPIAITSVVLVLIGLYIKEFSVRYYLLGQIVFLVAVILVTLRMFAIIPYHDFYRYLITFAIFIDMCFLLIAQYIKTNFEINQLKKNKEILINQSHFSSIGQAIGDISHQWKIPLTQVSTSFLLIQTTLNHDKDNLITNLKQEIPKLTTSLSLMKKTMDEFSDYYTKEIKKEYFNPADIISNIANILNSKVILNNVKIILDIDRNMKIYGYENIFSNIIMIFIDNSLDAFQMDNKNNKIRISIEEKEKENFFIFTYTDNAGGIKIEPIEKVFDYFVTSKKNKSGQGIGLAMAKILVEERLNSKINLRNIDQGVEFKLLIKK